MDEFDILAPWTFIHSPEFTTDVVIEEVREIYSTQVLEGQPTIQFHSRTVEEECVDEGDVHEEKFILRLLATNTTENRRYLWVNDEGEVRTDGYYGHLGTFFEVIHWLPVGNTHSTYQIICQGGAYKNHILYMDSTSLMTRPYHSAIDDHDITTKFQMKPKGHDISVRALISQTGIPIYFDEEGNYRPEGPPTPRGDKAETKLQALFFIIANVHTMKVTTV